MSNLCPEPPPPGLLHCSYLQVGPSQSCIHYRPLNRVQGLIRSPFLKHCHNQGCLDRYPPPRQHLVGGLVPFNGPSILFLTPPSYQILLSRRSIRVPVGDIGLDHISGQILEAGKRRLSPLCMISLADRPASSNLPWVTPVVPVLRAFSEE